MTKLIYKRKGKVPDCVSDFLERVSPGSATVAKEMGQLTEAGMKEEDFQRMCLSFASGVQYVSDRYNTAPKKIILCDQLDEDLPDPQPLVFDVNEHTQAIYNPHDQVIKISRAWLRNIFINHKQDFFADLLYEQHPISRAEYVFLTGIEEAYHHKQKFGGSKAQRKGYYTIDDKLSDGKLPEDDYWDDPQEREARKIVLAAARELGMLDPRHLGGRS